MLTVTLMVTGCAGKNPSNVPGGTAYTQQAQPPAASTRLAGPVNQARPLSEPAPDTAVSLDNGDVVRRRNRPVKVGLLLPLTGNGADIGQALFQSAQLAMFQLGDDNFTLVPRDTRGTPEGAAAAMQALLTERVELVLGPLFNSSVSAVKPLAASAHVNMIAFTTDWREAAPGAYVMGILPFSQVDRIIGYAAAQGLTRLGILAPETLYGDVVVNTAMQAAQLYGLTVTRQTRYPDDTADMRPVVEAFTDYQARKAALTQVVADLQTRSDTASKQALRQLKGRETYGDPPYDAALIVEGGRRMGIIGPLLPYYDVDPKLVQLLGTGIWDDRSLRREPTLQGAWFASADPSRRERFTAEYRKVFAAAPPRIATLAYDAVALAAVLARRDADFYASDKEIRQAAWTSQIYREDVLTNPNGFAGTDGIFRFRPDGLVERGLAVLEIEPDTTALIDPAPESFRAPTINSGADMGDAGTGSGF